MSVQFSKANAFQQSMNRPLTSPVVAPGLTPANDVFFSATQKPSSRIGKGVIPTIAVGAAVIAGCIGAIVGIESHHDGNTNQPGATFSAKTSSSHSAGSNANMRAQEVNGILVIYQGKPITDKAWEQLLTMAQARTDNPKSTDVFRLGARDQYLEAIIGKDGKIALYLIDKTPPAHS